MNIDLYNMLRSSAIADLNKAKLTLNLLGDKAVGIGDHSTEDFYNNAEQALALFVDANDRIQALEELNALNAIN